MLAEARSVIAFDPNYKDDEEHKSQIIVYEGFLTQLVTGQLSLSTPYYTHVMAALKRMSCVRQLKRGGGNAPSQWELIRQPTLKAFLEAQPKKTKAQTKDAMLQDQINTLTKRVSEVETVQTQILGRLTELFGIETSGESTGTDG